MYSRAWIINNYYINVFMAPDGEDGNPYQLEKAMLTLNSSSSLLS